MTIANERELIADGIRRSVASLERLLDPAYVSAILAAGELIAASLREGGKLLVFGNGGSAADAQHIAAEFLGRYLLERRALPAIALTDNTSTLTAIGNDYGFADIFARQIAGIGRAGDVALAISTSGNSENVLAGVAAAAANGLRTIGLTGGDGGRLAEQVELCIVVPGDGTPRIQEGHTLVAHLICELVERRIVVGG